MDNANAFRFATRALHAGHDTKTMTASRGVPIHATSGYVFDSAQHAADLFALKEVGHIYTRLQNPTTDVFEQRVASLEGGLAGVAFASGLAAIQGTICTLCHAGQNFVTGTSLYGGTYSMFAHTLRQLGIEARFFDPAKPETIADLVDENTRCVYLETIGNPKWDVPDFDAISQQAKAAKVPVIVDNTSASPALFRPLEHGADIVLHSSTKYLNGHGTHMGGVVVDGGSFQWADDPEKWPQFCKPLDAYHGMVFEEALRPMGNIAFIVHLRANWLRDTGACLSPFGSFLMLQGIETLHLRMPAHSENGLAIAEWLEQHPGVSWVNYSGLKSHADHGNAMKYLPRGQGGMMSFGAKGGKAAGEKIVSAARLASHVANIGDAKTLIIHPASTTHAQLNEEQQASAGVAPETVRLSVGIEDVEDIKEDLDQAIRAAM